ncbi:Thiamine repressible genes regulatory protein thi1 like [Verticillium longisporum]|nr:Thiamine repressible genes regulatory protein thi1 like [Verticillium longisporum]
MQREEERQRDAQPGADARSTPDPAHPSLDNLTPEEANRIIHSHRKVRYGTACWPCRQRKVKCDNQQPCENCVKRDHPQLCSYKPNRTSSGKPTTAATTTTKTTTTTVSTATGESSGTRKRPHSPDPATDDPSRTPSQRQPSWPRAFASVDEAEAPESITRYLGHNSIPSLLREQSSSADVHQGGDIRQDMRSILGLDTSAPFPLMSSHHLDSLTREISSELPSDREVMKLFRTYKETPQAFWGFVVDIDDLESKLMVYLEDRARNARNSTKTTKPVSASWLAILFAVLAVGSQYHDSPFHIRTRDSQKYIQISFHFLRLGNFLLRPTFDSIQALLLTGFVLLNDMKAEASWALLGLTCRLAQSLGLHRPFTQDDRESLPPHLKTREMIRRKLWWTCVWHDTLTSLSFDRSPMTNFPCCPIPTASDAGEGNYTYLETMYHLCEIISRRLNPDITTAVSYEQMVDNCHAVESLRTMIAPNIQFKDQCKSVVDRLQYYGIRLHSSFVISVCCRPALHRDCTQLSPEQNKRESDAGSGVASGARTPLLLHQPPFPLQPSNGNALAPTTNPLASTALDPHQDAALAMAEMQQNGTPMPTDYTAGLPGVYPPPQGPGFDGLAGIDPATYMSPMDLYESIWWESPDPWNSGVDAMNLDFTAHPPPGQPQQQYYF